MLEELRNFIMEQYAIPGKEIDEHFYERICLIMSKEMQLDEKYKGLLFEDYYKDASGKESKDIMEAYEPGILKVHVYRGAIKKLIDDVINKGGKNYTEQERSILKYIIAAQATMHEMVHVQQAKFAELGDLNGKRPRTKIIHKSNVLSVENLNHIIFSSLNSGKNAMDVVDSAVEKYRAFLLNKYGCLIVEEHDAQVQSFGMLSEIMNAYKDRYPHINRYLQTNYEYNCLMGYRANNGYAESPVHSVISFLLMNNLTSTEDLDWMGSDTEDTLRKSIENVPNARKRASLGLPITAREFNEIAARCNMAMDEGYICKTYDTAAAREVLENRE